MASIGNIALYFAFLLTCYAVLTAFVGLKTKKKSYIESSRGATLASFLMILIAFLILLHALITENFQFAYVADYTNKSLDLLYKISAAWAGQEGSILLWLLLLSGITAIVQYKTRDKENDLILVSLLNLIRLFFVFLLIKVNSPFKTLEGVPFDGMGLNPMLQSIGMVFHPPVLFLGYSGFAVPFVYIIKGLFKRESFSLDEIRSWVLFSWLMLTAGMVTGGNWAYTELGWGGYWAWDPVENASLFPWLTSTALLHTLMIQKRQGGFKIWNCILIASTFVLTIFGTFLTRSGILDSVHAFNNSQAGHYFLFMIIILALVFVYLLITRFSLLKSQLKQKTTLFSKEMSLLLTNLLLMMIFTGVFIGTLFPLISRVFSGRQIVLDQVYYNNLTFPFWLSLIFLMGICPFLSWTKTQPGRLKKILILPGIFTLLTMVLLVVFNIGKFLAIFSFGIAVFSFTGILQEYFEIVRKYRREKSLNLISFLRNLLKNKRRHGAHIVHTGVIIILIGIAGGIFQQQTIKILSPGEQMEICGYLLNYIGLTPVHEEGYTKVMATIEVFRGDRFIGKVLPEKVFYPAYPQPATNVGILKTLRDDVYVNLAGWSNEKAHIQVSINPLNNWIWIGSYVIYLGVFIIMFPISLVIKPRGE